MNLRGCFFAAQKALPLMRRGGAIVFTGSIGSRLAVPGNVIYATAKAGLRAAARILAVELVGQGIRVNMVSPGPTETPIINRNIGMDAAAVDALRQAMIANTPMHRMGEPEEIARAVLFLASDEASFITGVDLFVDGGVIEPNQTVGGDLGPGRALLEARLSSCRNARRKRGNSSMRDAALARRSAGRVLLGSDFVQRALMQDDGLLAGWWLRGARSGATGLPEYRACCSARGAGCWPTR